MCRVALFFLLVVSATLSIAEAQEAQPPSTPLPGLPSATAATRSPRVQPVSSISSAQAAPVTAYYPPPDSLHGPLTADDVCRSLRGGLPGAEVAQDVRERGLVGAFGDDEAADARAAGAPPELVAALQSGRFAVSAAYARRYAEQATKRQRAVEVNAWRAQAATKAQADERENESQRQSQLAAANNQAAVAKEQEGQQRFERMKDKADWEQRQREAYNANSGYWSYGVSRSYSGSGTSSRRHKSSR